MECISGQTHNGSSGIGKARIADLLLLPLDAGHLGEIIGYGLIELLDLSFVQSIRLTLDQDNRR